MPPKKKDEKDKKEDGVPAELDEALKAAPTAGTGKFYFGEEATYEGDWELRRDPNEPPPPPEPEEDPKAKKKPAKKGDPAEEAPPPPPAKMIRIRHGRGTYVEGKYSYQGEWFEDKMHGQGTFKYESGAVYEGEWVEGKYHGRGKYSWPNGASYMGEWRDNTMHGQGTYTAPDGHQWVGKFFNGSGPGLTCCL
eukprot:jgi/Mesvir1/15601/Mv03210-RA.1